MPMRNRHNAQGYRPFSVFRQKRTSTGSSSTIVLPGTPDYRWVDVAVADWADDDGSGTTISPAYDTALFSGTLKAVDLVHTLNSETAIATGYINTTTNRRYFGHVFTDQIWIDNDTLRVWLHVAPTDDIKVLVLR